MKPQWAPTPLVSPGQIGVRMEVRLPRWRGLQILWHGMSFLAWRYSGVRTSRQVGRRLRKHFEQLEGLFAKVAQVLALRIDVFGAEVCNELASAWGTSAGFAPDIARRIFEDATGMSIRMAFRQFTDAPVAAASIGQIHRARMADGRSVAVKIQRPLAPQLYAADLRVLRRLARCIGWTVPQFRLAEMLDELTRMMAEELDYRYEARWTKVMRRQLKRDRVAAPKVFAQYTTARTLVLEWIGGVRLADLIAVLQSDRAKALAWCQTNRIRLTRVAKRLIFMLNRMVHEDGRFHGDLHPANILLLRKSRIALVDFGTCARLDREIVRRLRAWSEALAAHEYVRAAEHFLRQCASVPTKGLDGLIARLATAMRDWTVRTGIADLPYWQKSGGALGVILTDIASAAGCHQDATRLRINRAYLTLDGSLAIIAPEGNFAKWGRQYLKKAAKREAEQGRAWQALERTAQDMAEAVDLRTTAWRRRAIGAWS